MRSIDTVLFDKTGTLTKGAHVVTGVAATGGLDEDGVLRLAAAVEADSEHPLARAIVNAAATAGRRSRGDGLPVAHRAAASRRPSTVCPTPSAARRCCASGQLDVPDDLRSRSTDGSGAAPRCSTWCSDDQLVGALALEDEIRPEAREAVAELRQMGVDVAMITGDARQVADAVGRDLGIDEVFAEVLPEDKDQAVSQLQQRGVSVAMVGDGVNDAPALARADVGLAIGAGTDVAIESAGVVLASSDPRSVAGVIRLSRASYRKMIQNLAWAAGYNIVAIPLAAGALAWAGVTLSPAVGAILMSLSTIVVALNAQLLRRVRLVPEQHESPDPTGTP